MAGTASELCVNNNGTNYEIYGFELFSSWLFGKINAKCLLLEINLDGCNFLMPTSQPVPEGEFKLVIMCPDDAKKVHTIISARPHWVDNEFSLTHKKLNCSFVNLDAGTSGEINVLKSFLDEHYEKYIRCDIFKC